MRRLLLFFVFCCAAWGASPARGEGLYLGGASRGATSDYAFLGAILPVLDGGAGHGPGLRVWGDYLSYTYGGAGGTITASGLGGALAAVYQFSGDWGWANGSAGVAYRNTHLSADDPGNRQRGSHAYLNVQADGGYNLDDVWRLRGLASYTPQTQGYIAQAGLDRAIWHDLRLGANAMVQGDSNYQQISGGLTAFFQIAPGFELAPTVGVSRGSNSTAAYGGLTAVLIVN